MLEIRIINTGSESGALDPDVLEIRMPNTGSESGALDPDVLEIWMPNTAPVVVVNPVDARGNLDKPLLRRKSDLPTDILTQKSLESYQVGVKCFIYKKNI